jgi:hypothetical protein
MVGFYFILFYSTLVKLSPEGLKKVLSFSFFFTLQVYNYALVRVHAIDKSSNKSDCTMIFWLHAKFARY